MSWMRPRGESASWPVSVYVGHAGRQSPQWTHERAREYVRGSSCRATFFASGKMVCGAFIDSSTLPRERFELVLGVEGALEALEQVAEGSGFDVDQVSGRG